MKFVIFSIKEMKLVILFTVLISSLSRNLKSAKHLSMKRNVLKDSLKRLAKMEPTSKIDFDKLPVFKNQKKPSGTKPWTDDIFPPNEYSLVGKDANGKFLDDEKKAKEAINELMLDEEGKQRFKDPKFLRIKEIEKENGITNYYLFNNGNPNPIDINQGVSAGDCYFLASASSLAKYPELIKRLFEIKEINDEGGYYSIALFIEGKWQKVYVDDYLPVQKERINYFLQDKTYYYLFAYSRFKDPNLDVLWPNLLEKAWAKVNGGYANIRNGFSDEAFTALTGFLSDTFKIPEINPQSSYNEVKKYIQKSINAGQPLTAGGLDYTIAKKRNLLKINNDSKKFESELLNGIYTNHLYSIFGLYDTGEDLIITLRNPHGYDQTYVGEKFKALDDDSNNLIEQKLSEEDLNNIVGYHTIGNYNLDDLDTWETGLFYMSFDEFINSFCEIYRGNIIKDSYRKMISFDSSKDEGDGRIVQLYNPEPGDFCFQIIYNDWRLHRQINDQILSLLLLFKLEEESEQTNYNNVKLLNITQSGYAICTHLNEGNYVLYANKELLPKAKEILKNEKLIYNLLIHSNSPFVTKVIEKRDEYGKLHPYLHSLLWRDADARDRIDELKFWPIKDKESGKQLGEKAVLNNAGFKIYIVSNKKNEEQMDFTSSYKNLELLTNIHLIIEPKGFDIFATRNSDYSSVGKAYDDTVKFIPADEKQAGPTVKEQVEKFMRIYEKDENDFNLLKQKKEIYDHDFPTISEKDYDS